MTDLILNTDLISTNNTDKMNLNSLKSEMAKLRLFSMMLSFMNSDVALGCVICSPSR